MNDPKPGQLWEWTFAVGTGGWMFQRVTEQGRHVAFAGGYKMLIRGDTFIVLSVDDSGPYLLPRVPTLDPRDDHGGVQHRYHIILCKGDMLWMRHVEFEQAELRRDV